MYCVENIAMARAKNLKIEQQAEAMASHCLTNPCAWFKGLLVAMAWETKVRQDHKTQSSQKTIYIHLPLHQKNSLSQA
jgi:hypothetical protein